MLSEESESNDEVSDYFASQGVTIQNEDSKANVIGKMAALFLSDK